MGLGSKRRKVLQVKRTSWKHTSTLLLNFRRTIMFVSLSFDLFLIHHLFLIHSLSFLICSFEVLVSSSFSLNALLISVSDCYPNAGVYTQATLDSFWSSVELTFYLLGFCCTWKPLASTSDLSVTTTDMITFNSGLDMCIYSSVEQLWWSFLPKQFAAKICILFLLKGSIKMFYRVVNALWSFLFLLVICLKYFKLFFIRLVCN